MSKKLNKKGNASGMQSFIIILAAIALFVIFTLINPGFASSGNLLTMAKSFVPYAILALGATFAIATGGIDLRVMGRIQLEVIRQLMADRFGIAVRAGLHCAPYAHASAGTLETGTVRVSIGYDTFEEEIAGFLRAAWKLPPYSL